MLLQIAQAGISRAPHQHRLAVGIDLGTTNSLVASVLSGTAAVIRDAQQRALLPSVVRYRAPASDTSLAPVVGHEAQASQSEDPHNTLSSVKRLMGRSLADIQGLGGLVLCLGRYAGHGANRNGGRHQEPGRGFGRHSAHPAPARRSGAGRLAERCRDHRAGLF